MADGFIFAYIKGGASYQQEDIVLADGENISSGTILNLESGEADLAVTADTELLGVSVEDVDNTNDGLSIAVITDPNVVFSVEDNNARSIGDTLDIAAGARGVAASVNADLVVVRDSTATERTLVTYNGNHFLS